MIFSPPSAFNRAPTAATSRLRLPASNVERGSSFDPSASQRLCDLALLATAAVFDVPVAEVLAPTRRSSASALARQTAMYIAHVVFELSFAEIGRTFGRDRTTAAHACRTIEDRRTDPTFNLALAVIEDVCDRLHAQNQRTVATTEDMG